MFFFIPDYGKSQPHEAKQLLRIRLKRVKVPDNKEPIIQNETFQFDSLCVTRNKTAFTRYSKTNHQPKLQTTPSSGPKEREGKTKDPPKQSFHILQRLKSIIGPNAKQLTKRSSLGEMKPDK